MRILEDRGTGARLFGVVETRERKIPYFFSTGGKEATEPRTPGPPRTQILGLFSTHHRKNSRRQGQRILHRPHPPCCCAWAPLRSPGRCVYVQLTDGPGAGPLVFWSSCVFFVWMDDNNGILPPSLPVVMDESAYCCGVDLPRGQGSSNLFLLRPRESASWRAFTHRHLSHAMFPRTPPCMCM